MARRGKTLAFEDEEIEELVDMSYGDKRLFPLLTLVFPFINAGYTFHIAHVFPKAAFNKRQLEKLGYGDAEIARLKEKSDRLLNLKLLLAAVNSEKRKVLPASWLVSQYPDEAKRKSEIDAHLLGSFPEGVGDFDAFYDARLEALRDRISHLLVSAGPTVSA